MYILSCSLISQAPVSVRYDNAYITWLSDGVPVWTLYSAGMGPDTATEISARPVPQEPMVCMLEVQNQFFISRDYLHDQYIIANLGFSPNFGWIDYDDLTFPTTMSIDYIRVYQPAGGSLGCDPPDFPTAAYIETYIDAYVRLHPLLIHRETDHRSHCTD